MRKHLTICAAIMTIASCATTSGSGDQVITGSIQDYRSCTVKTMSQTLGSKQRVNIKETVDRRCSSHMNRFGTELAQAGVSQAKIRTYQSQLRTTTLQYSTAAIAAIIYQKDHKT
ncbi:hypothetical protein [Rhizobium sp. BK176]|uniref:hypothetical protein n=1 Tax=Rhizobium sp. BK176 TaxID=2587071 RepID=UPI002168BD47|nr:hypothetical protein [Rhizobium sp. BK176]MCS4089126.1 serine phosphatase RsbU (regulator of sigma subunit) [Rhizobium sp. BK176]